MKVSWLPLAATLVAGVLPAGLAHGQPAPGSMPAPVLTTPDADSTPEAQPAVCFLPPPPSAPAAEAVPFVWYLPAAPGARPAVHALVQVDAFPYVGPAALPEQGDAAAAAGPRLTVHRAYAGADALLGGRTAVVFDASLAPTIDRGTLALRPVADAYLAYQIDLAATPVVGVTRLPLTRWSLMPENEQPTGLAPLAVTALVPDRRAGAAIAGDLGVIRYVAGAYERAPFLQLPAPTGPAPPIGGLLIGGRLELEPIGPVGRSLSAETPDSPWYHRFRVAAGGSLFAGAGSSASRTLMAAADLAAKAGPVALTGEFIYDKESTAISRGGYGEAGVFLWPGRLELLGRFDWLAQAATPGAATASVFGGVGGLRYLDPSGFSASATYEYRSGGHSLAVVEIGAAF